MPDPSLQVTDRVGALSSRGLRVGVTIICLLEGPLFIWAGVTLPWGDAWPFLSVCSVLGLLHVATAVTALLGHARGFRISWALLSWASLLGLAGASFALFTTAWYVATLFRGLGVGIGAAILAVWGLLVLLTLPIASWGLSITRGNASLGKRAHAAILGALIFGAALSTAWAHTAAAKPLALDIPAVQKALTVELRRAPTTNGISRTSSTDVGPAHCLDSPNLHAFTLLISHLSHPEFQARSSCIQAESLNSLQAKFSTFLSAQALPTPMILDLVSATQELDERLPWIDLLKLRPGLDGICDGSSCLAPWQLTARDRFMSAALGVDADARLGIDAAVLRLDLGSKGGGLAGLLRVETQTWVVQRDLLLVPYQRGRKTFSAPSPELVAQAQAGARQYILGAAQPDGLFRYTLNPFSGVEDVQSVNLARQAGTTLALCELGGTQPEVTALERRALGYLTANAVYFGSFATLEASGSTEGGLNSLALPLAAFLTCRPRVGGEFDTLIAQLARTLLHVQNQDGSFAASFDLVHANAVNRHKVLYAEGQAVLALVLLEQALNRQHAMGEPELAGWPALHTVHAAVARAMDYVAHRYWSHPLRSFFFLEENWHCLAARAALTVHRDTDYERFCLDYVAFKSRLIMDSDSVESQLVGGYGVGTFSLPHTTASAGFGEALAAAIAIKRARKEPVVAETALMRKVLGFLLMSQWNVENCFACANPNLANGGFSRHLASPEIRIDYVQHAWAALGHGSRTIGLSEEI